MSAHVALMMREWFGAVEIERLGQLPRGDEIPSRTPAADVIERSELARNMIGLVVARRHGGDQADVFRHHRERRQRARADAGAEQELLEVLRPGVGGRGQGTVQAAGDHVGCQHVMASGQLQVRQTGCGFGDRARLAQ